MKKIAVIMGSDSDLPVAEKAISTLRSYGVPFEVHVFSAHRTPDEAKAFAEDARKNGFGAIIALAGMAAHLAGALAAYLVFNVDRASVFMGDTGSLALGGFAAAITLFSGNALLLPFLGAMFVVSSISVILQVISYKARRKRIFLMAPIHHHFQEKGYSESKIAYCYAAVTALMGLLLLIPYL